MARESQADLRKRTRKILSVLDRLYPNADSALHRRNPLQLLVATILSAQCTDVQVNRVTKDLFRKYKTPEDYASADQKELETDIHSTGFFRNKAKNIRASAKKIIEDFGGKVPDTMDGLLSLPGVARKTANCVLGSAFGKNEGVVVDTHVQRLAGRLGFSREKTPVKIEQDLIALIPRRRWTGFSHQLIHHGRACCKARKPDCPSCRLNKLCPSAVLA